ncbi:hypothetical protein [Burkholderia territorii]|nr:hypothetical protein [Burkholderia territorii]
MTYPTWMLHWMWHRHLQGRAGDGAVLSWTLAASGVTALLLSAVALSVPGQAPLKAASAGVSRASVAPSAPTTSLHEVAGNETPAGNGEHSAPWASAASDSDVHPAVNTPEAATNLTDALPPLPSGGLPADAQWVDTARAPVIPALPGMRQHDRPRQAGVKQQSGRNHGNAHD